MYCTLYIQMYCWKDLLMCFEVDCNFGSWKMSSQILQIIHIHVLTYKTINYQGEKNSGCFFCKCTYHYFEIDKNGLLIVWTCIVSRVYFHTSYYSVPDHWSFTGNVKQRGREKVPRGGTGLPDRPPYTLLLPLPG